MSNAANPVTPKPPAADKPTSAEQKQDEFTEHTMRDYFASQPKVSIKTREDEWVQVNGYTFIIKKGERVDVPTDVAEMLEEAGRI